jgi:hypothetical protein
MKETSLLKLWLGILTLCFTLGIAKAQSTGTTSDAPPPAPTDSQQDMQEIVVKGVKDPELASYRAMYAGIEAFAKYHHLAPEVSEVRFQLVPKASLPKVNFKDLTITLRGNDASIPIPVSEHGKFSLPINQAAYDEDAELVLNRRKGLFQGRPDVRTPGIPANMRRLGDLRLECEVKTSIAKRQMNFALRAAVAAATLGMDMCQSKHMTIGFSADAELAGVRLISGERRLTLEPGLSGFSGTHFFPPLWDQSWPDDTLIEFHFAAPSTTGSEQAMLQR